VALQLAVQQALVADSGFQLQKALVSVQEWMLSTGRTAEAFSLESVSAGLRDIQSQLDATFNRPTKETLQLSLQRAELEKRRLLILQSGASSDDARVKAIDLELQGLDNLISLRKTELDIMRIHAQLADETVLADIDQVTQIRLLTSAVTIASQQVEHFGNIVAMQAFAMVGFTAQQKAYINAVARLKGEEEPYPGFAMGIKRVPYDMIAKVHKDERITSAQENMALINGRSGGSAAPSLTIAAGAVQVMVNGTPDRPQIQELREELMHALEEFAHENDMRGWAGSSGGGIPV